MLRFEVITSKEFDKYVLSKRAIIIDVRSKEAFDKEHIRNAVNIPFDRLEKQYNKMPKDFILILYCERGGSSMIAAKELFDRGHVVKALMGGLQGYTGKYREQ